MMVSDSPSDFWLWWLSTIWGQVLGNPHTRLRVVARQIGKHIVESESINNGEM
jgi:hypothetical protein